MNSSSVSMKDTEGVFFPAQGYFLGIAQNILESLESATVALPGIGEVHLFPSRNAYYTDIHDLADFCSAPASQFKVTILGEAPAANTQERHIRELMWQAAFHASRGNLIDSCSKFDVVQFLRWPNLTRLPKTQNTMRICALLTRYPMTIMLVDRKLGIDKKELYQIYSAAYCAGLARIVSTIDKEPANETAVGVTSEETGSERGFLSSLFSKITRL